MMREASRRSGDFPEVFFCFIDLFYICSVPENCTHTNKKSESAAKCYAEPIVEYFSDCAHQNGTNTTDCHDDHVFKCIYSCAHLFWNISLHSSNTQSSTVCSKKTGDCTICEHQWIGQSQQTHIHQFIDGIDSECNMVFLFCWNLNVILYKPSDGTSQKLCYRK